MSSFRTRFLSPSTCPQQPQQPSTCPDLIDGDPSYSKQEVLFDDKMSSFRTRFLSPSTCPQDPSYTKQEVLFDDKMSSFRTRFLSPSTCPQQPSTCPDLIARTRKFAVLFDGILGIVNITAAPPMSLASLIPILTIGTCVVSFASAIPGTLARRTTLVVAFLTVTARILSLLLPTTRMVVLDRVLDEMELTVIDYVENGLSPFDVLFMKLKLQASSLRTETRRIESSLWRECWACFNGHLLAILRCQRAAQALHVRMLNDIESHRLILLEEDVEHLSNNPFLGNANGNDVSNVHEIAIPAPCVIAGSYRLRRPPTNEVTSEVSPNTIMMDFINNLNLN